MSEEFAMSPERVRRTQDTFTIGDLSREFDITTRSIRFYEDQGLIIPERRGQTRIYKQKDRVRLKLILRGKRLGFTLAETKTLFDMYERDGSSVNQLQTMLALIEEKKSALRQQLEDIKVVLHELSAVETGCRTELATKTASSAN
ncbi:MerR family transcriptional regulator [Aliidiomarina indica]|uniref:MerR family transcriptional regulator n=1 Tax=Aliidiomarina indica TaxID=2749147 RepID=UPI001E4D7B92|nr:MerR family DNA-binding transcriptional regulator [Aliidiomarina indica]